MADFEQACLLTLKNEAGYSDHPADRGEETYRGIARNFHPDWPGWARIDQYKNAGAFPQVLDADAAIKNFTHDFYRNLFWIPINGDEIPNQALANFLFDMAVHTGIPPAVKILQRGLNVLNREGIVWADLLVDGKLGQKTLVAIRACLAYDREAYLMKILLGLRIAYYVKAVESREKNEAFMRGWLNRVRIS